MTAPTLAAPDTTTAVLEARSLTKHFAVHGHVPDVGRRLVRRGLLQWCTRSMTYRWR